MANPLMKHGAMNWMELMTSDIKGAKDFYSKIFNWKFEEYDSDSPMEYHMVTVEGDEMPFGGVYDKKDAMVDTDEMPSNWGNVITVTSIDDTIKKVQSLGGNIIVPKTNIPKVGDFSVIQDPQGAVVSIMEYCEEMKNC